MRLCALSRCIFSPSEYAFTINRQGRNTGGTAQASSGRRENPAAVADPLREIQPEAGRLQTGSGSCGRSSAREAGRRQRAQIRPLRPPQAVLERRESHSAIICTDEKKKAAAGVSGCRCQIHAAARSDQEGQAAQDAVGNPAAGKSHIGKLAGSRGRRSGLRDAQTGSDRLRSLRESRCRRGSSARNPGAGHWKTSDGSESRDAQAASVSAGR